MLKEPILLADGNPLNLKLTRLVLEIEGYQVQIARSADEVFDVLQHFNPRLILLDLGLPGMNGLDVARKIKGDPVTSDIRILMVTSDEESNLPQKIMEAGCEGHLPKPIDTQKLPDIVAGYLSRGKTGGN